MTDESALTALSYEYADAVRQLDAERWAATWTDDARWVLGPGRVAVGRDAIVEMWRTSIARYATVVQLYTCASFDVTGAEATGRLQLLELSLVSDGSPYLLAGHYDDTYRRTAQGWRYTSRELTKYYSGPPDLTGNFVAAMREDDQLGEYGSSTT